MTSRTYTRLTAVLFTIVFAAVPQHTPVLLGAAALALLAGLRTAGAGGPSVFGLPTGMAVSRERRSAVVIATAFLLYATVTAGWSITPVETLSRVLKLAAIGGLGLFVIAAPKPAGREAATLRGLALGLLGLAVLIALVNAIDPIRFYTTDADTYRAANLVNQPATLLALFFWPVGLFLWRTGARRFAALLAVVSLIALVQPETKAAAIALVVSGAAAAFCLAARRVAVSAFGLAIVLVTAGLPFLATRSGFVCRGLDLAAGFGHSAEHRILIWHFTAEKVLERPIAGWGLDSARAIPGGSDRLAASWAAYPDCAPDSITNLLPGIAQNLPLHPHNGLLQLSLELGLPAAVLTALAFAWSLRRLLRHAVPRTTAATVLATATAWLTVTGLSYGLWQSWWLSATALAAACLAAAAGLPDAQRRAAAAESPSR